MKCPIINIIQYLCTHSVHFWTYFTPCYWKARLHLTNLKSRHTNWLKLREGTPYIRDEAYMQVWDTWNLWKNNLQRLQTCLGTPVFRKKHPKWQVRTYTWVRFLFVSSTCKILQKYTKNTVISKSSWFDAASKQIQGFLVPGLLQVRSPPEISDVFHRTGFSSKISGRSSMPLVKRDVKMRPF